MNEAIGVREWGCRGQLARHSRALLARIFLGRLSSRNVEDLLFERGIDLCHETVRYWWNRFGPMFAADIRRQRVCRFRHWRWHLDEVFVKINGETHYLWRTVDHEREILKSYVTKTRDKKAVLASMKKT